MSYYKTAFEKLIKVGVPRWYIRLYLLSELIYFSRIYVYRNVYEIETQDGWYSATGISIKSTPDDGNQKFYGELKSMGFPNWDEYKILFDGDEYEGLAGFMAAYDRQKEEWIQERELEININYAN